MLVKEKFKDEIVEIAINEERLAVNKNTKEVASCARFNCNECLFFNTKKRCTQTIDYFNSEYIGPPLLNDTEYTILKAAVRQNKKLKYIARDRLEDDINGLSIYTHKPFKENGLWNCSIGYYVNFNAFCCLFKFIKWDEEPYLIEDLLENYEKGKNHENN